MRGQLVAIHWSLGAGNECDEGECLQLQLNCSCMLCVKANIRSMNREYKHLEP